MDKVAIYCRLSDEDKNKNNCTQESESIQNQKSILINHALLQNWEIYKIYCDEDYSGVDAERPEWNQMIIDAHNKKFNIILCKTQSRFTRDMEMVEKYLHNLFPLWGIRFISLVDKADTFSKSNKKARQINGLINEWYLEDLSENIKAVLDNKRKNGKYIGSIPLYGYLKDPIDHNSLVVDKDAAEIVKKIFDLYISGYGVLKIANILNEQGTLNPTHYKWSKGLNFKKHKCGTHGHLWSCSTIRSILCNQMYIGNMVQGINKKVSYKNKKQVRASKDEWFIIDNTHEAIIQKEVFSQVQQLLSNSPKPQHNGQVHIFAGKVRCINCGSNMHKNSAKGIQYLRCTAHNLDKNSCKSLGVPLEYIEKIVLNEFEKMIYYYVSKDELCDCIVRRSVNLSIEKLQEKYNKLTLEINELSEILINIYRDKVKNIISEQQFAELNAEIIKRRETLIKNKKATNNLIDSEKGKSLNLPSIQQIVDRYFNLECLYRDIVNEFIDYMAVGNIDKQIHINIYWRF